MIIRENIVDVEEYKLNILLEDKEVPCRPEDIIFFDLEHYVYKKPKCVGVFGACIYNNDDKKLHVTQYMIENKNEVVEILLLAKKYFQNMKKLNKKVIVTFSGNNDFTVIKYLFNKYNIYFDFEREFKTLDIQKQYERDMHTSIGLKNLEKNFDIHRESEVISGSNLAKTFHKILKDKEYIERMPKEKIETILLYNEQDVVNLYRIFIKWKAYINYPKDEEIILEEPEEMINSEPEISDDAENMEENKDEALNTNGELNEKDELIKTKDESDTLLLE